VHVFSVGRDQPCQAFQRGVAVALVATSPWVWHLGQREAKDKAEWGLWSYVSITEVGNVSGMVLESTGQDPRDKETRSHLGSLSSSFKGNCRR
jgi:hypothetical protein